MAELKISAVNLGGTATAKVYGDDVDDAVTWASTNRPSQITKTSASADVSISSTGVHTVDVTSIIQEIVNRPGWSSNNNLRLAGLSTIFSGSNIAIIEAYEKSSPTVGPAVLEVTFGEAVVEETAEQPAVFFGSVF